ncbi:MAG: acyl-CoA thioesterase [Betaproteobacteria bacterium]|jgi:4-hydroxybenzoyl-CoA thioesterase|nr:acyl-CoA thioesterase [Betaproteobacteria bacterium]NBT68521.1 acyl-CoA thioesterase [Betaproteobacteria bacterium]NBY06591.1 acyl-CoA thioesterase [Betaproteobacteria bacterium]
MTNSSLPRTSTYTQRVEFGDCDPAGIVWFPHFFRWIDAASRHFFISCGVPSWQETTTTLGVIGTPLVDTQAQFTKTATYGDVLVITTSITEWRNKSFVQDHRIHRGEDAIMSCQEVRIFAGVKKDSPSSIYAMPIAPSIRSLCE